MRKYQTSLAIGFFLGVIFIMTQQMLILFAIFVERSKQPSMQADPATKSSSEAMATFSFFLFLLYSSFGTMLAVFRNDVIKQEENEKEQNYDSNDVSYEPEKNENTV